MTSLLPEVDLVDAMKSHSDGLRAAATERYTTQVGRAHTGLVKLAHKAASRHDDAVDATNAAADLLERFSDSVESNGDAIVGSLAQQQSSNQGQAQELAAAEQRADEADRDARNQRVEIEAMRDQVAAAERDAAEATRKEAEANRKLADMTTERNQLARDADKPNPLKSANDQLQADNRQLLSAKSDLEAKLATVTAERDELQTQLDAIRDNVEKPAADPDDPSGEAAEKGPMIGDFTGEEQPVEAGSEPKKSWLRGRLPGHGRNQDGD